MTAAVFLDRDNTLIANDGDLGDPDAVRLLDGVGPALKALRDAGYRLVVVTNQAGVARGRFTEADVDAVHQRIADLVDHDTGDPHVIDRFYYCPYHPEAVLEEYRRDHPWRKPNPGMLVHAARDLGLDLRQSWMVGDQVRDVEAGRAAGCRTVLISSSAERIAKAGATLDVRTIADAAHEILRRPGPPPTTNGHAADRAAAVGSAAGAVATLDAPPAARTRPAAAPAPAAGPRPDAGPVPGPGAVPRPVVRPSAPSSAPSGAPSADTLHRAVRELTEELRQERAQHREFTALRMGAAFVQLIVLLLAMLGLLQAANFELFAKWMIGAGLVQLVVIAMLLADPRR